MKSINQIISSHNPYPSKNERKPTNKQANASKQKNKNKIKKTHTPQNQNKQIDKIMN